MKEQLFKAMCAALEKEQEAKVIWLIANREKEAACAAYRAYIAKGENENA